MKKPRKKLVNLTPHQIKIVTDTEEVVLESEGVARLVENTKQIGTLNGIPVVIKEYGTIEGIPDPPEDDTVYIVSSVVLAANSTLGYLAAPDTGETAIRNEKGQIVAVKQIIMGKRAVTGSTKFTPNN